MDARAVEESTQQAHDATAVAAAAAHAHAHVNHHDAAAAAVAAASGEHHHALIDDSLDKYDDATSDLGSSSRKREAEGGDDDYDDDDDDASTEYGGNAKDDAKDGKLGRSGKRSRRHNWQQKYELEFGLIAIERDAVTGDVTLAMCGFCKAFGREGKYEQLLASDADGGTTAETKKRRRRSLTTTKFFRAFRVDNIRSHLQGAHPRRWAEFEMLPKQEAVRARFLQLQGDLPYDSLQMVDDVVLSGSALNTESDIAYAQAQAQALAHPTTLPESTHHHHHQGAVTTQSGAGLNGGHSSNHQLAAMVR